MRTTSAVAGTASLRCSTRIARFSVLFLSTVVAFLASGVAPNALAQTRTPAHARLQGGTGLRGFQINTGKLSSWTVTTVSVSRRESNARAERDSQPWQRYFYKGDWRALGRTTGWFEKFGLSWGPYSAQAVVLVSVFETAARARSAYATVTPSVGTLPAGAAVPLSIGSQAMEWRTNWGVGSGPQGLIGSFGGYTTYVQAGTTVAEIRTDEYVDGGARPANAGRAIARHLAKVAEDHR